MAADNDALEFIRVSTGSQDESTQVTSLDDYADTHALHVVHRMVLHGYSASHGMQEPALREAIKGIGQGRWKLILVTDSSRLDRREDLDAQAEILLAIRQAGGDVISITEPQFGKTDFAGRIVTLVAQYGNAEKSRKVKEMTWRGVKAIIDNEAWYGPLPVFWKARGERFHKVATCTDPRAVQDIYRAVSDSRSLSSVARRYQTYPQSIRKLIRCRANTTGVFECRYTYDGQTYKWEHKAAGEPPVDADLWYAANRVMGERGAVMNNLGGRPVQLARSWISGLLACPGCGGHLYVLRGKTLRCGGRGKNRHSCGVSGIPLDYVTRQVESIIARDDVRVYRYQRVSGNQSELDSLKEELSQVRHALGSTDDDDEFERLSKRRKELRREIKDFTLIPDSYDMTPTDETLASLWHTGDKRSIMKALQRYIVFNVSWGKDVPEKARGYVWIEGYYPGDALIDLSDDTCIRMNL